MSLFRFSYFYFFRRADTPSALCFYQVFLNKRRNCLNKRATLIPNKQDAYTTQRVNNTTTSRCISPHQTSPPSGPASPSSPAPTLSVPCPPVKKSLHSAKPSLGVGNGVANHVVNLVLMPLLMMRAVLLVMSSDIVGDSILV